MLPTFDPEYLAYYLELDKEAGIQLVDELITLFEQHTPPLLEKVVVALTDHDWETAKVIAHRLKGSCASIGGMQLSALCAQIDDALAAQNPQHASLLARHLMTHYDHLVALIEEQRVEWAKL